MSQPAPSKINGLAKVDASTKPKSKSMLDRMLEDNGFVYLNTPFSVSPYYDFLDAFLLGLKLDTYFSYSTDCINALVYTADDFAYF